MLHWRRDRSQPAVKKMRKLAPEGDNSILLKNMTESELRREEQQFKNQISNKNRREVKREMHNIYKLDS
jgi:hypothetical protein